MQWFYLIGLLVAIGGLVLFDYRYKLAFFFRAKQAGFTIAIAVWLFIVWDIFGIKLGIFHHGNSPYALPFRIIPEFPIEEVFFLILLTYTSLLVYRFVKVKRS